MMCRQGPGRIPRPYLAGEGSAGRGNSGTGQTIEQFWRRSDRTRLPRGASAAWCDFLPRERCVVKEVAPGSARSEEHTSELQSRFDLVCRLLLEKKKEKRNRLISEKHTKHDTM